MKGVTDVSASMPCKLTDVQAYQKYYYPDLIKPFFDASLKEALESGVPANVLKDQRVGLMLTFTKSKFEKEPESLQNTVRTQAEQEYERQMKTYLSCNEWKGDAKSYSLMFDKFDDVVTSVTDSLAMLLGCGITIVVLNSVIPDAAVNINLPDYAGPEHMQEFHGLFTGLAATVFSEETIKSRKIANPRWVSRPSFINHLPDQQLATLEPVKVTRPESAQSSSLSPSVLTTAHLISSQSQAVPAPGVPTPSPPTTSSLPLLNNGFPSTSHLMTPTSHNTSVEGQSLCSQHSPSSDCAYDYQLNGQQQHIPMPELGHTATDQLSMAPFGGASALPLSAFPLHSPLGNHEDQNISPHLHYPLPLPITPTPPVDGWKENQPDGWPKKCTSPDTPTKVDVRQVRQLKRSACSNRGVASSHVPQLHVDINVKAGVNAKKVQPKKKRQLKKEQDSTAGGGEGVSGTNGSTASGKKVRKGKK
ncbi:hypothetical protein Moror_14375 [Moniliophthora roreri MCA 2997]|uniref:Uncharacterized protein n=1 Tax=Moniliophthora roreri (strain MCA 2997) TaxID=1381753 RepID=V2XSW9_MONRO|nr:hypothetical protein Moror_14375 [Moniliophthora roreri MCA 2997]